MFRIYKYHLPSEDCTIKLPVGATTLRANIQHDGFFIWCVVNIEAKLEERRFVTLATGQDIEEVSKLQYIDTIFTNGFVFHVFEVEL